MQPYLVVYYTQQILYHVLSSAQPTRNAGILPPACYQRYGLCFPCSKTNRHATCTTNTSPRLMVLPFHSVVPSVPIMSDVKATNFPVWLAAPIQLATTNSGLVPES